uniref:Inner centromere protein ARK-binding domain-containing protein n=1 Tax=Leersia perrieri TaxID=77586 RepID=A0A0D9XEU5_9ORYZ
MEELFMQVFERRDWVVEQMRQQVESSGESLACALLAAGRRPPPWLLPSRPGAPQELNGRPALSEFVFPGSCITTPAANRTIFQLPAVPSTSLRNVGVPGYSHLGTACTSLDTNQHQEVQQEQTKVNEEFAKTSCEANMFSLVQRSRSRQKNIEDRLCEKDKSGNSGSSDGSQDMMKRSKLASVGLNRNVALSSSEPAPSFRDLENDLDANKRNSTEFFKCSKEVSLGNEGVHLDCSSSLVLENRIVSSENNLKVPNDCTARGSSRTKVADSACHLLTESHLSVEPKVLQFEDVGSVCMNSSNEKMRQPLESAPESAHFDLTEAHPLNEDPSTACCHVPRSMGSSLLDGVGSGFLNPESGTVMQNLQCGSLGFTAMHSQNEDPIPTISSEVPRCIREISSLKGPCSKVSQLLEKEESKACSVANPLLETNALHTVESAERVRKLITQNSTPLEQQSSDSHVLPHPHSGSLQLADSSFERPPSPGVLPDSLLEENGLGHLSHSVVNDTKSQCSSYRSAASPDLLPPRLINSGDVYQPSLSCCKSQSNNKLSNGCAVEDATVSIEKQSSQEQCLLDRSPIELDKNFADEDTTLGHTLSTHSEMLKGKAATDLVNCNSGKLSNVDRKPRDLTEESGFSYRKNEPMVQSVARTISTGVMHTTERSSISSTMRFTGAHQQDGTICLFLVGCYRIEQETSLIEDAVQINTNQCTTENNKEIKSSRPSVRYSLRSLTSHKKINLLQSEGRSAASDQKRSGTDGVKVNGGSSSKRRRINCQSDVALSSSRNTNSLLANHRVDTDGHVLTVENFSGRSLSSGHYFLRGSGSSECMPPRLERRNGASHCKISVASMDNENSNYSPERNSMDSLNNENMNSSGQLQNTVDDVKTTAALPSCYDALTDNKELCTEEENFCLDDRHTNDTNPSVAHHQMTQMDNITSQSVVLDPEIYSRVKSVTMSPSYASDQLGDQAYGPSALVHENLSYGSNAELDRRCQSNSSRGHLLSGASVTRQEGDESGDCDDTMPEFERFDVPIQFDSPSVETRTFEALRESITLSSKFSKYDYTETGLQKLLSTMSGKSIECSFPDDLQKYSANNARNITSIFGTCGLGLDDSVSIYDVTASCSSNASTRQENNDNPLTPSVEKYNPGKVSARSRSSSEQMGSIPELSCFRIDEHSSIAEENEYQGRSHGSVGLNYSKQLPSGRKALQDITGLCQNTVNSASLSSVFKDTDSIDLAAETCSNKLNSYTDIVNDHVSDKPKNNLATSAKREGKVSLHNRLRSTELQNRKGRRHQSEANMEKQPKPSNIVANVASFIPLVKPKLQPATTCVKKDVKVKALEAAEAAKRLEEKKQNEREMRKATAKLERERLKHEKELKQKQEEEQKKKRDADVAAKKRQREEEERKEKERKRKCTEEARKLQKQPMEKKHAVNDEKDVRKKASDNKELRKDVVDAVKVQVKPDVKTTEPALDYKTTHCNNEMGLAVDEKPASLGSHPMTNIPCSPEESYQMSPYKDSDEEDDDDFEHEKESRRRRKTIPSWARKENLEKFLISNRTLDPREVFAQKCSFNLSEVLSAHIPKRGFM